jgi:hypothetical protein
MHFHLALKLLALQDSRVTVTHSIWIAIGNFLDLIQMLRSLRVFLNTFGRFKTISRKVYSLLASANVIVA